MNNIGLKIRDSINFGKATRMLNNFQTINTLMVCWYLFKSFIFE